MTALDTRPALRVTLASSLLQATRREQLIAAAGRFGQMDVRDERWVFEEPALDQLLEEAVQFSTSPRGAVWQAIVDETGTPLAVKLRTLAAAVASLAR